MKMPRFGITRVLPFGNVKGAATYFLELSLISASYVGLNKLAVSFPAINPAATPLWPTTGLALALTLLRGYRVWPAILIGAFSPCIIAGRSPVEAASVAIGTLLGAFAGTWLIDRWSNGYRTFDKPAGVAKFSIISFAPSTLVSSVVVVAAFVFATNSSVGESVIAWVIWWLADAAGTLAITPVVVLWARMRRRDFLNWRFLESLVLFGLVGMIGVAAYGPIDGSGLNDAINVVLSYRSLVGFLVLMPMTWAVFRGKRMDVATIALIFLGLLGWGVSEGNNLISETDADQTLLSLLVLSIGISVPPLTLAAAIATHQSTEIRLRSARDHLNADLERTQVTLNSAKRHFQMLIEGVVDYAIFALDKEGHVASWNIGAQRVMGYAAEEIIGQHFGIFYRPDERRVGAPNRAMESAIQLGKHTIEGWLIRKDGTLAFITGTLSSVQDDAGNLIGFANVLRDATERRDAHEKLVEAREQLAMSQKMEAIGKLTGGIAHDFNNLLMIIGGSAQLFSRLLDPKLPRAIEAIQSAAKRGESLTRQLLTFSRHQPLNPTVIDLNAAIRHMRPMIESSLRGNIVYEENLDEEVWPVKVDLAELELAIVNIAVNARDAMPSGGTFLVSANNVTPDPGAQDNRAFVAISCNDTGTGIPPNHLSKMFDPFFTTKEVGKGTGLGLSQVYGFAHQAGGTVKAESAVGRGTTITVYLPPCVGEQIGEYSSAGTKATQSNGQRVLVVDDNADVAEVTSSLFEHLGYETVYRDSAEAALDLLEEGTKIDLVFSDIVMPGTIDEIGLAREIGSQYPDLQVVLTTGYSDAAKEVPAHFRILRKPFDADTLREVIDDIARSRLIRSYSST